MTIDSSLVIELHLTTSWGSIDTVCTGIGRIRPLRLEVGDIVPISLKRRDLRMSDSYQAKTLITIQGHGIYKLKHTMKMHQDIGLEGWIRVCENINEEDPISKQTIIKGEFLLGAFTIPITSHLQLNDEALDYVDQSTFKLILTSKEWFYQTTLDKIASAHNLKSLKLVPHSKSSGTKPDRFAVFNNDEVYGQIFAYLKQELHRFRLSVSRVNATPQIDFCQIDNDPTLVLNGGLIIHDGLQDSGWALGRIYIDLKSGKVSLDSSSEGAALSRQSSKVKFYTNGRYELHLEGYHFVLDGARQPGFQFAHSSWLWSYSKVKVKNEDKVVTRWLRWAIPSADSKAKVIIDATNRIHLNCNLLLKPSGSSVAITSCSINPLSGASITLDGDHIEINASDLDIEMSVQGLSFLPSSSQKDTPDTPHHNGSQHLATPEAAPALLEPSSGVQLADLIFRLAPSASQNLIRLESSSTCASFDSTTTDFKILGSLHVLDYIQPGTALLTLPSASAQNVQQTLSENGSWDPNQGQSLRAVSSLTISANESINVVSLDTQATSDCRSSSFAIRTLLPWVEWRDQNSAVLYHRNLVCDFDEWLIGGVDRSPSATGEDSQKGSHSLTMIHDLYAEAASITSPLNRDNWWPGLTFPPECSLSLDKEIELDNEPYDSGPIFPSLKRGDFTLSLQPRPLEQLWLEASITSFSVTDGNPNDATATIDQEYSNIKACLSTDLLVHQSCFLDQGGFLRKDPVVSGHNQLLSQQLIFYSPHNTPKSLYRLSGSRHFEYYSTAVDITVSFFDFLLEVDPSASTLPPNTRFLQAEHRDSENSHHLSIATGSILLSGSGIFGCPVELTRLVFLTTDKNDGNADFSRILSICFEGVITLLRSVGDDGEQIRVDVKAKFTLVDDKIQIEPLSSSGSPPGCIHIDLPSSHVPRFPHSSIASPITHICGKLELASNRLCLSDITAFVDFFGSQRRITYFPKLYTVDGLHWSSYHLELNSGYPPAPEPIWSWPNGFQAIHNGESQESWKPIPFRCVPPAQPSDFQASLAGMLWSSPQQGLFRFHRFLDPENPVVYDLNDQSGGAIIAWDLLSTDSLRSGSDGEHCRLLAVLLKNSTTGKYHLQVCDEQGLQSNLLDLGPYEPSTQTPIINWVNTKSINFSALLVVIIANTLSIFSFDQAKNTISLLHSSTDPDVENLINIFPTHADYASRSLTLAFICSAKIVFMKFKYSEPAETTCRTIRIDNLPSIDQALALSDRLAIRTKNQGWYFYPLNIVDDVEITGTPLHMSNAIETIVEHSGSLYAAETVQNTSPTSKILRLVPSAAGHVTGYQWQHVTTLPDQIDHGLSTPLGPWWFSKNNYDIFGMDGVVEWDANGMRAQLAFECPINPAPAATDPSSSEQKAPPILHWRTTWGASAWLQLSHPKENGATDTEISTSQKRQLALARDVQEGQIAFTIPDFQPPSHLRLQETEWIWNSGALLLWNEPGSDSSSLGLGGALINEGICPWNQLNISINGFPEPASTSSTLAHCLNIGWSHEGEWQSDRRVTAALHRQDGWTLQLHEQRLNAKTSISCMGLLTYADKNGVGGCQLPVILNTNPQPSGQTQLHLQSGLYRLSQHQGVGSGQLDLCLYGADCINDCVTPEYYDIEPQQNQDAGSDQWVVLISGNNGEPLLNSIRKEIAPHYLDVGITLAGPKQPIREIQFGHRRIFGARLRFLTEPLSVIDPKTALLWNQAYTYYADRYSADNILSEDNPSYGSHVLSLLHGLSSNQLPADWARFSEYWLANNWATDPKNVWNSGSDQMTRGWRQIQEPTDQYMIKGDCIVTWAAADSSEQAFIPPSNHQTFDIASSKHRWIGALLAQIDNNIVLIREPFWQSKKPVHVPPISWRSENLLIMGRSPAASHQSKQSVPVIACLRSVSDVIEGETSLRGLSDDEARTWLLAHGSQGFALRRVCNDQGPSQYQFLRSPFVQAGQEQEIDSASTTAPEPIAVPASEPTSAPNTQTDPTHGTPQPTNPPPTLVPFYYHPADITNDSEHAPVPVFRSPQRRVRLKLNPPASVDIASDSNKDKDMIKTLLLHETVAYPNRIQNRTPLIDNQPQTNAVNLEAHSFLPGCIDFAYGTDKPGGMVIHTVTPLFTSKLADSTNPPSPLPPAGGHALGERGQGPLTEFLMRDPLHYQPPENSAIEVRSCRFKKTDKGFFRADLVFDDVLGTVNRPVGSLFTAQHPPDASQDPPFSFNPQAIKILSRVGDQLFVIDQDSDFIPCDESKQIYILCRKSAKPYLVDPLPAIPTSDGGPTYYFQLKGIEFKSDELPTCINTDDDPLVLLPFKIDALASNNMKFYWEITTSSSDRGKDAYFCFFNNTFCRENEVETRPVRVMPVLVSPKVAIVLQKYRNNNDSYEVLRESTELFGSVSSSRLSLSAPPSNDTQMLRIYSQHHVFWEPRDADWVVNNNGEVTNAIVVKYFPNGASFAASKTLEMPSANP